MKCKDCRRTLSYSYYLIGDKELCKRCALEMIGDIKEFRVNIERRQEK